MARLSYLTDDGTETTVEARDITIASGHPSDHILISDAYLRAVGSDLRVSNSRVRDEGGSYVTYDGPSQPSNPLLTGPRPAGSAGRR